MFNLPRIRPTLAAPLLIASLFGGAPVSVDASEPYRCIWKVITIYEKVEKPVVHWVLRYDRAGNPYHEKVVSHETIQVPVTRRIKICY